jgi:hypothetical protein
MRPFAPIRTETKNKVLERDQYRCVRCGTALTKSTVKIDRIDRKNPATNYLPNLRSLCRVRCATRIENLPYVDTPKLVEEGALPSEGRSLCWDNDDLARTTP